MQEVIDLDFKRLQREMRASWQCRVLVKARTHDRAVVSSIMAHCFDGAILTIMQAAFPGFERIAPPFICSAGQIAKTGAIVADVWEKDGRISKDQVMYRDDIAYRDAMRHLADRLKLDDQERLEFFTCVKRWLVADRRLDPTMDPADPDAKRLTIN